MSDRQRRFRLSPSAFRLSTLFSLVLFAIAGIAILTADARSRSLALNTLKLVGGTLAIGLPLGTFVGILIARTDLPLRRTAAATLGLLLVIPLYLQAAGWQSGFGTFGWYTLAFGSPLESPWLEGWRGAIFVHVMAAVPWVALIVGLASRQVEPQLEEMALLDARPWQVFRRVTLPRIWPAIGLAAIWVAILAATDMTVTDLYQVRTYAEEVYTDFAGAADPSAPEISTLVAATVVTALTAAAMIVCTGAAQQSARLLPRRTIRFPLGRWRIPSTSFIIALLIVMFGVPIFSCLYKAGIVVTKTDADIVRSWSLAKCAEIIAVSPGRFHTEFALSIRIAFFAASLAVLAALPLAWRARRGGIGALPALIIGAICLAVPAPVLGVELIHLLDNPDLPWLNGLYHTSVAPIIGQAIRALPLALFIIWFGFRSIPQEQFESAAIDGAGRFARFWHIALPMRWPAIVAAWVMAFIYCFGELPTTQLLQPPGPMTLPVAIYQLMHGSGEDRLAGIALATMLGYALIAVALVFAAKFVAWPRHGQWVLR